MSLLHRLARYVAADYFALTCLVASRANAQLDPDDYSAIASSWTPAAGTITINTDALTIGGVAGNGVAVTQLNGGPEIAAFTFGAIDIAAGVTINVTGSRALALLAQDAAGSSFILNGTINASGGAAGAPLGGTAGPGGFRGGNGGAGLAAGRPGSAGAGLGGGGGAGVGNDGGGGAGFGGAGGDSFAPTQNSNFGGLEHGNLFGIFHGGSGGGGGGGGSLGSASNLGAVGGGGGGAVELVSNGQLMFGGAVNAIGSAGSHGTTATYGGGGGGGSGGGVILAAEAIQQTGSITLNGGSGGQGKYLMSFMGGLHIGSGGGGGGGGRAVVRLPQFIFDQINGLTLANANLSGGAGGNISCCTPPNPLPQDRAGQPGQPGEGLVLAGQLLIPASEALTLTGTPEYTSPTNANFRIRGNSYRVDGGGATLTLDQIVQSINGIEVANGGQATATASALTLGVNSISGDGSAGSAIHYAGTTLVNGKLKGATHHTIDMHVNPTVLNSTLVNFGATVQQNSAAVFNSVANGGTIYNNAATLDLVGGFNAGTMYVNSQINTSEDWFSTGTMHIANAAAWDHSGANLTNAGEIYLGTEANPGGIIDLNGTTLQNSGSIANNGTINGDILSSADGIITGGGTINGSVTNSSVVAPGNSPGSLAISGDYTQSAGGELAVELASFSSFDQLVVTGNATLAGMLTVNLIDGFTPSIGQTFTILTADDLDGVFTTETLPSVPGLFFDVIYNPNSVVLTVRPAFTADFDEDGDVDGDDLTRWRNNFDTGTTHTTGDADGDGDSDGHDFLTWQRQLGSPGGAVVSSTTASAAIPEPASDGLMLAAAVGIAVGTCRRRG